jgi:toxin ParE1/3/4
VRAIRWTRRARGDLAAIKSYIAEDSPIYSDLVITRIIAATDRLARFPKSGRVVPEVGIEEIREVIHRPYRIVYRLVGEDQIHILTVHHSARHFREDDS